MTPKTIPKSLPELRQLPHLSVSQLKVFLACPRKYALAYIERIPPQFRPIALAFGTAFHEAVGYHLLSSSRTSPVDRNAVKDIFRERLSIAVEGETIPVLFDEGEDLGKSIDLGVRMLDALLDRLELPDQVIDVEVPFSLDIADPDYGDVLGVPLIGAIDALVVHDGKPAVWELKTSKRKWYADQLEYDLQPTAYQMAAEQLGYPEPELRMIVVTKGARPEVQMEQVVRTDADRADLAVTAQSVVTAIEAGIDHPVRGWACRGCPYAYSCR